MSEELKSLQTVYGENVLMMRVDDCLIFGNKNALRSLAEKLTESPSVEPEHKWIPVSEALPKDTDMLLVTIVRSDGSKRVRSGHYYKGYFMLDNGDTWNETDKEVLAWMPLVEPYTAAANLENNK